MAYLIYGPLPFSPFDDLNLVRITRRAQAFVSKRRVSPAPSNHQPRD